ncbi:GNAT family N-acetyltransferase [Patescibacteria group bacterium]|nr:MAG: GNAT family N-acetyltransferase [Patescibacteria group bacterium]
METISISILETATEENLKELVRLSQQLHQDTRTTNAHEVLSLIQSSGAFLVVAKDSEKIIGMGSLYVQQKIGKRFAYIEDVIVDDTYRGKGIGRDIMNHLIETARVNGVRSITLTSRAERTAAHSLYEKLGFVKRETEVFRLNLS